MPLGAVRCDPRQQPPAPRRRQAVQRVQHWPDIRRDIPAGREKGAERPCDQRRIVQIAQHRGHPSGLARAVAASEAPVKFRPRRQHLPRQ
jgi:hypothetical protein